jgi:hypothetical protein
LQKLKNLQKNLLAALWSAIKPAFCADAARVRWLLDMLATATQ